jgi:filamentous hemagglutinin family protein
VMAAQQAAAAQAAAAGQRAQTSLAQAAAALQAMKTAQQNAHALASQAPSGVPNGLVTGGLVPDPGIASDPTLWQGANLPVQTNPNGRVQVDINQFQQKAILNWQTFNVGSNTTVNFNQPGTDSIVLNRVNDPSAAPSRILGQINAPGAVYIINHNGIIFGGGSQIDVHTLIASDLDVGSIGMSRSQRDTFFLNTGVGSAATTLTGATSPTQSFSTTGGLTDPPDSTGIVVQPGASITTSVVSPDSPGLIGLFGANVANSGTLSSPAGEVALVAAQAITFLPGAYQAATFPSAVLSGTGFRGIGFQLQQYASSYTAQGGVPRFGYIQGTGGVTNDGLIETPRGIVVMNGDTITIGQQGVISADTSITRNSMVLLDAATSVDMEGTISVLPDQNGETLPLVNGSATTGSSTSQTFNPPFIEMSGQLNVTLGPSGLVSAPSASVSLNAESNFFTNNVTVSLSGNTFLIPVDVAASQSALPQRVLLEPGATIDVAGLQDVALPASYNFISFQPRGQEFADMPLQRGGPLFGQTLWIDIRASGTRSDGTTWVGTPLADASGYVDEVGQSISQLMTVGGAVSLKTDLTKGVSGNDVVLQAGSVINTAGGSLLFLPGMVPTTRLIGSDGHLYTMANADPNITYVGIAGQFTADHPHWGVTETWSSLTQTFSPGYVEGHDAGGVAITTINPVMEGTLLFGSLPGERQIAAGLAPSGSNGIAPQQTNGDQLPSQGYLTLYTPSSVVIGAAGTPALPDGFTPDTVLSAPATPAPGPSSNFTAQSAFQMLLSASQLSSYGLSALGISANDLVVQAGSSLSLAAGGRFSVTVGGAIDIAGPVSAPGGQITLVTDRFGFQNNNAFVAPITQSGAADIFVEGVLDVSGRWVNDTGAVGTQALGPGYINGGSISIATDNNSFNGEQDTTGSIFLAAGSVLDVSSGGYISPRGLPKTVAPDVMAGSAGSISLALYQGTDFTSSNSGGGPITPTSGTVAQLQLDGTLRGYGFQSGGSLTLGSPKLIQIGGQPLGTGDGLQLSLSLFHDDGFGSFTIESTPDQYSGATAEVVVAAGVSLTLQQQNLSGTLDYHSVPTGTNIAAVAPLVTLPDDERTPVNLTLKSGNILLDAGSSIVTDPKAQISLIGAPDYAPGAASPANPAQDVLLLGTIVDHGGAVAINAANTWLGPQALIDLSGTFIAASRFGEPGGPLVSGTLLPGGTFTIDAAPPGAVTAPNLTGTSVVAQSGAVVDVSGAAATILALNTGVGAASTPVTVPSWADAGTVSVNAGAFVWGGQFRASAPDPRASGGTLMLGGAAISLEQTSADVTAALAGTATPSTPTGLGAITGFAKLDVVAVDLLAPFSNIFLYAGSAVGGAKRIFTDLPDNTYGIAPPSLTTFNIDGSVDLNVADRLEIAASTITPKAPSSTIDVTLAAPYVDLTSSFDPRSNIVTHANGTLGLTTPVSGTSSLTVKAQTIDIESASLSGFAQSSLISTGDIRLSTPKGENGFQPSAANPTIVDQSTFPGALESAGDLVLSAQRIYPVSAVNFTITTPGSVTFEAPAGSSTAVPLSAGGSITVSALNIQQNGNLFAPLGQITLGGGGTQQVTLGAGSLTSVSLGDTLVPFGRTEDGINWFYNDSALPLTAPSAKSLVLDGQNVTVAAGSTVDVSGGGDLQAMEFIAGKGGSRDTLTTTPSGQTVYALLPASSDPVGAFDIDMTAATSGSAGDAYPLAGTQIYLAGGNGIAAGVYTLYSGHYATLPGALRVVDDGSNLGRNVPSGTTLPDGTTLISGYYTQSTSPQTRTSGSELFAVQTNAVWSSYSQYGYTSANSYFPQQAQKNGVNIPSLPMDAGRLAVVAQQAIVLAGTALSQPATGGRGGQLDLSGNQLDVVSPQQLASGSVPNGYIGIDVTQLDQFGFESVLIGGLRTDEANGTLITPTATNVLVDTHGVALTVPEILLVAQPSMSVQALTPAPSVSSAGSTYQLQVSVLTEAAGSGSVTIASGSVIETTGQLQTGFGRNYFFASPSAGSSGAQAIATELGGTLDARGTVINGANVLALPIYQNGAVVVPGGLGTPATPLGYPGNVGGGALFVATDDPSLTVAGPTAGSAPSLTINFRNIGSSTVSGTLVLPASSPQGAVSIASGATISTQTMTVQATAQSNAITLDPAATINAKQINLTAGTIGIGASSTDSLSLSGANLSQLAGAQGLSLKTLAGGITFYGAVDFNPGATMQSLVMDAGSITGTGSDVAINIGGGTLTLVNSGAANAGAPPTAPTTGTFEVDAAEIDLAGGAQTIAGFSQVSWNAGNRIFVESSGALTLGVNGAAVNLAMTTPNILVGGGTSSGAGSQFTLGTPGSVTIATPTGTQIAPVASSEIGGNLAITAAGITDNGTIQAQAGTLTLDATGPGGLNLGGNAYIAAGGYKVSLRDVDTYVAGGKVVLQADVGNVVTAAGSFIDLSQPAGGLGYGGELDVVAGGNAQLSGAIQANGGSGLGGSFKLDTVGSLALDPLADQLLAGGFFGTIDIHTLQGNLGLSQGHILEGNSVTLTADDQSLGNGAVTIAGLIDARGFAGTTANGTGEAGGTVALYGANAVILSTTGMIDAATTHADKRGGNVTLGIGTNATGYIDLQGGTIDVSGGTQGGLSGGTVLLRAPQIQGTAGPGSDQIRIQGLNATITGATDAGSVTVEDYVTISTDGSIGFNGSGPQGWNGIIDPANPANDFFTSAVSSFVNGTLAGGGKSFGFGGAIVQLGQLATSLGTTKSTGQSVLQLEPGIDLVNDNLTINKGDITVLSNWNLAAGTAGNLSYVNGIPYFTNQSYVNFNYRLVEQFGNQPVQVAPGVLTLQAVGNINVAGETSTVLGKTEYFGASISDGFFQFHNYLDPGYVTLAANYLRNAGTQDRGTDANLYELNTFSSLGPVPVAPYAPASNTPSPTSSALAAADLLPNTLNVCTANCGTGAPAVVAITDPGSWSYRFTAGADVTSANPNATLPLTSFEVLLGKGSVVLTNHSTYTQQLSSGFVTVNLPEMVRTGTGSISIAAAQDVELQDTTAPGVIYTAGVNTAKLPDPGYQATTEANGQVTVTATNPNGFLEPQLLLYSNLGSAQTDQNTGFVGVFGPPTAAAFPEGAGDINIVAQRDLVGIGNATTGPAGNPGPNLSAFQYFAPWLLSDATITPGSSASLLGAGVFAPSAANIASQSAWWIQFGSFQQGILSAGGNVTATAGRDMIDLSISLPTTGRVSGGLASTSTPVTNVYGSGDMTVQVGRNLLGGAFYEGSGSASIVVRGSVAANGMLTIKSGPLPDAPLLAVDSGQIQLVAGGSISIAGVINPAELHQQVGSAADPAASSGNVNSLYMDTYGQHSAVSLLAIAGDLNIASSPTATIYGSAPSIYPASLDGVALRGDITTNGLTGGKFPGIVLSGSEDGTFGLLAQGSIDLTGGLPSTALSTAFPVFSAGPALLDAAFNPFQPNDGFDGASSAPVLAQVQNTHDATIYALTGDITGAGAIQINRPTSVYAGLDIVDLNLTVENIAATDVSTVEAGRDIRYTGLHNLGGLEIAGPGYFVVQAGRDLGPFLPAALDNVKQATVQEGIASVGNAGAIPVGNQFLPTGSIGMYDPALLGPYKAPTSSNPTEKRNALLPAAGADVIALAGVANGADYAAVIATYIDPANAANVPHNYLPELQTFLAGIGIATTGTDSAWTAFNQLPVALQQIFVDQIFFAELKSIGIVTNSSFQKNQVGYRMVNTLFPANLGYTANALGGGTNGASQTVHTGDINLLHATIQTDRGGDISLFAPGGNILVGSLATEPNPNLKLNNLGILTLAGGAINTFTDVSVLVNSSRVFTEQGGDILMWSSNGDLDAGRGSKTTVSLPPLDVVYNGDAYQSIDLSGLVTGAGIGVLKTSSDAATANLYLLAPHGTIDAGDAGIRVSGNAILEAPVVLNANNIQVSGTTTGVPVVAAPNVGALTAASSAAGAATKTAELPTGAVGNADQSSVFLVEVIGYGGGNGGSDQPTGSTDQPPDQTDKKKGETGN